MAVLVWPLAVVVFLALLWTVSSVARCLIKWTIFGVGSMISACAPIPLMLLRPRDSRNALIPSAGFRACCRFLGISLKVEGKENVVEGSGSVVLINHQSFLDLMVLACLWPVMDNCTVISKKEIFYLQPFGLASWLWGTIFIDRVNAKDAQSRVNQTAEIIRKRKARVLMFPEGTRNLGNKKLLPFKKGAFHLAVTSGCPIQPVAVCRYRFLGPLRFDSGSIKIKILPSIATTGLTKDDIPKLMDQTYALLSENVDLLSTDDVISSTTSRNGTKID